eukprot:TRINITY_DN67174_c5_g7_i1.p1 TRINITY_DN67174_c5_g7~~TRINITY_DN67174_c5_g7_i1.p1  ORF type:complete len:465 (+),score=255.07 TRINITY_DN67174_c5_g7_i1:160-1554(+)
MGCVGSSQPKVNPERVDESHFEIYRVLGRGGFGKVHAVMHRNSNVMMAMKRMSKDQIIAKGSTPHVWVERDIMALFSGKPFLVALEYSYQTPTELIIIMPFLAGGDLKFNLLKNGAAKERQARFYAAELLVGLKAVHELGYVYRDIKPENCLMDNDGHAYLSDFGLAKRLRESRGYKHRGYAGTPGYTAPEVDADDYYSWQADVWSFGVLLYELLHGYRPYRSDTPAAEQKLKLKAGMSPECKDLIKQLLTIDPEKRIGGGGKQFGAVFQEVMNHKWFSSINWDDLIAKKIEPPIRPEQGVANCVAEFEIEDQLMTDDDPKMHKIPDDQQAQFKGWSFNCEIKPSPQPQSNTDVNDGDDDDAHGAGAGASAAAAAAESKQQQPPKSNDDEEKKKTAPESSAQDQQQQEEEEALEKSADEAKQSDEAPATDPATTTDDSKQDKAGDADDKAADQDATDQPPQSTA